MARCVTLRLLGGLTTDEIARAYVVPEPTIAQRIGWPHAFIIERISARRRRVEAVIDRAPQMKGGRIILPNALYLA